MSEWSNYKLDELGSVGRGKSRHRPRNAPHLYGGGYPFIQTGDVKKANMYISEFTQTYSDAGLAQSKLWDKGTLLITIAANIADVAILDIDACFPDSVIGFIPNKEICDVKYIKYYFDLFQKTFQQISQGSTQDNLSVEKLLSLKIPVPPLLTQQKIAKILSNYDDLIENNLKRIKLLEESARLTYEEWFLRFCIDGKKLDIDPETKLPFGWQDVLLTDYIDLLRGVEPGSSKYEEVKTDSNIPFIRVGDLSKRDSDIYVSKDLANNKIIDKDDILLSLDGSPGKVRFGLSGCYSTGIRKAVSKQKNVSSIFIYNLLNSPYIQGLIEAYATGATILHAGSSVKKMRLVLPTDEVLDKYNNIEMKKFQLILNLSDEIKLLKEARDILLPRLMTGMIDTDDMDIAV